MQLLVEVQLEHVHCVYVHTYVRMCHRCVSWPTAWGQWWCTTSLWSRASGVTGLQQPVMTLPQVRNTPHSDQHSTLWGEGEGEGEGQQDTGSGPDQGKCGYFYL